MWPHDVRKSDLRIDYYRGSGKGGQNRNKRDTACRITHIPTGKASSAEEYNSQAQNRAAAFSRLAGQLLPLMKPSVPEPERSEEVIRTYHEKRHEVKDHRVSDKTWNYSKVLDGDLGDVIREVKLAE